MLQYKILEKINWVKNKIITNKRGMGTVEIILIIVVLIGLVIIFKSQITALVQDIFEKITRQTNAI